MGRQKRPFERGPREAEGADRRRRPEVDPALLDQGSLGNQALQGRMGGEAEEPRVGLDVVRDVALPMVERSILALHVVPREVPQVDRFMEILRRSELEAPRRDELVDRVRADQAMATGIQEAVRRWFDADGEDFRSALIHSLDAVWNGLRDGAGDEEAGRWQLGEQGVELSEGALDGSVAARAEALVADLAGPLVTDEVVAQVGQERVGEAVRGFCRDVHLALSLEEEEEEELSPYAQAIEEG